MSTHRKFPAERQHHSHSLDQLLQRIRDAELRSKRKMNDTHPNSFAFGIHTNMSDAEPQPPSTLQADVVPHPALLPETGYLGSFAKFHKHTTSDSTNTSGSAQPSPTTSASTVDDSSATEPSPGSSPESPPPTTFAVGMLRPRTAGDAKGGFFELQKQPPPPKKGRNLKNLAVNTSGKPTPKPLALAPLGPSLAAPAPAPANLTILSPSFVKPPTPPRRRTANLGLTILTPGLSKGPPQEIRLAIPPTPSFSRPQTLRHFQSSPSLPIVTDLGPPVSDESDSKRRPPPLDSLFSPLKESFSIQEEEEQNFDIPLSREEKPEAYPDGPICVYDPGVDLYLEPTAAQASQYDVILNVASEVRNPFTAPVETPATDNELRIDGGGGIQYAPKRDRSAPMLSTTLPPAKDASPTTPKAGSLASSPSKDMQPEYVHIPWEHNSDIVPDLLRLCKLMDEKVMEGKRILVHCQCGVSRSASLVVAYGLYKAPSLSVQEAYDAVKARSKWIGPNMNLIMQLQEFRTSLANGGRLASNRGSGMSPITPSSAFSEWRTPFSGRSSYASVDVPLSAAPAPDPERKGSAPELRSVSPGPSSAPSGVAWPRSDSRASNLSRNPSVGRASSTFVDTSGHILPTLSAARPAKPNFSIPRITHEAASKLAPTMTSGPALPSSPRSSEFAMGPILPSQDVAAADDFGIMSPTSTEFSNSLFDRSALLASLGMGSMARDEDTPRRSLSIRSKEHRQQQEQDLRRQQAQPAAAPSRSFGLRRLQKKISAPSLREQEQLQSLQARIKASLPFRKSPSTLTTVDEALKSPRAFEFTKNPFALASPAASERPSEPLRPRTSDGSDPRSPAHTGANPITWNILDVL